MVDARQTLPHQSMLRPLTKAVFLFQVYVVHHRSIPHLWHMYLLKYRFIHLKWHFSGLKYQ